jgi:hypothetical protein
VDEEDDRSASFRAAGRGACGGDRNRCDGPDGRRGDGDGGHRRDTKAERVQIHLGKYTGAVEMIAEIGDEAGSAR